MLKKKEILNSLSNILDQINDKEGFCKEHGISTIDFYPYALGYLTAELEFLEADGDIFEMKHRSDS